VTKPKKVVIVGAGIAGLSTAFHLADKGVGGVVLLDKGRVGSGSSSRSGAVNTMLMATENATRARGISFDIFERFDRLLEDYHFHQDGCMGIYNPDQLAAASQLHDMHRAAGAHFEILDRQQIENRFPDLKVMDDECGVLDLRDGWSEPDRYIPALTAMVRTMGVEIIEHCTVDTFLIENGRVEGVRLSRGGELRADATVCTVNAWANSLLAQIDQPLPVRNFVHERFVTRPFDRPPRLPAVNCDAAGVYFRPTESNGLLLGSGGVESAQITPGVDFDLKELAPTPGSLSFILNAVGPRLPLMEDASIDYHRVGLVSYPIDFMPNVGPVAALPGLFLGTNFCSGGFGHHPMAGQLIAEYIVDGQTSFDGSDFDPDRFKDFDTVSYLAQTVSHHEMVETCAERTTGFVRKRH
jgi:glycine/D-amino acid oxidase-like deaminating enzyme